MKGKVLGRIRSITNKWLIQSRTSPKAEQRDAAMKYVKAGKYIEQEVRRLYEKESKN